MSQDNLSVDPVVDAKERIIMAAVVDECQVAKAAVEVLSKTELAVAKLLLAAPVPGAITTSILARTASIAALDTIVPHLVAGVVNEIMTLLDQPVMVDEVTPYQVGNTNITKRQLLLLAASVV